MLSNIDGPAICAAATWGGVATYFGTALLRGRMVCDLTLIDSSLSPKKAAFIGAVAAGLAQTVLDVGKSLVQRYYDKGLRQEKYMKNWSWLAFIPLIAVPYSTHVPLMTGVSLVSMIFLAAFAKHHTVGLL
jgi:hypothetical protein